MSDTMRTGRDAGITVQRNTGLWRIPPITLSLDIPNAHATTYLSVDEARELAERLTAAAAQETAA